MNENLRKSVGHECPPTVEPAPQPNPPKDSSACPRPPKPPDAPKPKKPGDCPKPDCCCKCDQPGTTVDCLEKFVVAQEGDVGAADKAKLKAELVKLVETTKKARQDYTREKYDELVDKWKKQDVLIADLLRKLECAVSCWKCILECHVCPLLNDLHYSEKWLYNDGELYDKVHDLYDQRYWLDGYREQAELTLNRIKNVLKAWESPATSIEKVINADDKDIEAIGKLIGSQPGKAIYDVFFRLVPFHLAIAPPKDVAETKIDKRFTEFCDCGDRAPDDCCGPDVGERSFRKRLIPPQAYLINPDDYFKLICCLIESRYEPAANTVIEINIQIDKLKSEIERHEKAIGPGWQAEFEKNAKAAIPSVIDCCEYEQEHDHDCDKKKYGQEDPKQEGEDEKKQENPNQYDQAGDKYEKDQS